MDRVSVKDQTRAWRATALAAGLLAAAALLGQNLLPRGYDRRADAAA